MDTKKKQSTEVSNFIVHVPEEGKKKPAKKKPPQKAPTNLGVRG